MTRIPGNSMSPPPSPRVNEVAAPRPAERTTAEPGNVFANGTQPSVVTAERNPRDGVHRSITGSSVATPGTVRPRARMSQALDTSQLNVVRSNQRELGNGNSGQDVKQLQALLQRAGYPIDSDGIYGPQTEQAVRDFQQKNNIAIDGIVGDQTMAKLDNLLHTGGASLPGAAPNQPNQPNQPAPAANAPANAPAAPLSEAQSVSPVSGNAQAQMQELLNHAKAQSQGQRPDGRCYSHVANFLDRVNYGNIGNNQFNNIVPGSHWAEARQFAEFADQGNLEKMGLRKLNIDNPYDAPPGSIVVVRAGTPGTSHPTAGDIAVKGEGDIFYNGGEMGYGGRHNFPPGNNHVMGIYVPK